MIKDYILYLKTCPGIKNPKHFKIGISQLSRARKRLSAYQNAVGPVWEESFLKVWIGDENHIRLAENYFKKREFKDKISSAEAGLSEWICEVELTTLLNYINELRNKYFLKFIDCPTKFLPLTMPLCEELEEWYTSNKVL